MIHATSGCNTTSRPYGTGMRIALRKFQTPVHLRALASRFLSSKVDQKSVIGTGEEMMVLLFGGMAGESLDALRYKMF